MDQFLAMLKARGSGGPPDAEICTIGIDLGTTNSAVSAITWIAGQAAPEAVRTLDIDQETPSGRHTSPLVPSVVCVGSDGPLVGQGAKVQRGRMSDHSFGLKRDRNIFWECKNHMGLTRTYHQAPEGYRSAKEIAGHVLEFLMTAAKQEEQAAVDRVVVTVPASFRIPQRQDTEEAAGLAGMELRPGDLVDEPVAAFLDYIFSHDISKLGLTGEPKNVLVFDFGGGTCDVAVFAVSISTETGRMTMAPRTVSRYHRLGGGDIDAAIVHDILIPQLVTQNNLASFDLSYEDKALCLAPALLSIAESLKIGLCKEISRLMKLGRFPDGEDRKTVFKRNPGITECVLSDGRRLALNSPTLNAVEFERLLDPFLDRDFLFARETEYRMTCSLFAPLTDAINRAGLSEEDIGVCLLAGGSSFIPRVQQALDPFFMNGFVLSFDTPEDAKLAISRGAAYHALCLELTGKGVVQPVAAEAVLIQTSRGPVELMPAHADLPFPASDTWADVDDLVVPAFKAGRPRNLRLELVSADQMRLFTGIWQVPEDVPKGSPLRFRYQVDANQIMRVRLNTASAPEDDFWEWKVENPLVNIEYPESKREEIETLEENIRTARIPRAQIPSTIVKVADLTADLGQRERALDLMKKALAARHGKDAGLLNKMGILCGEMRDYERQAKFYKASAETAQWGAPLFNLALSQKRRGELQQALQNIEEAIAREQEPPYLVLRATIADALHDPMKRDECLSKAMDLFGSTSSMSDWELGWYLTAADLMDDKAKVDEARKEQKRRKREDAQGSLDGMLPDRRST